MHASMKHIMASSPIHVATIFLLILSLSPAPFAIPIVDSLLSDIGSTDNRNATRNSFLPDPIHRLTGRGGDDSKPRKYIIRVRKAEGAVLSAAAEASGLYSSMLSSAFGANLGAAARPPQLVHSYSNVMSGFAARLTKTEVDALSKADWFVRAYPDRVYALQTTRSPQYLGLDRRGGGLWDATNMGEGIVVGVLDTGISPDHPSFRDDGMPPPPPKWKGRCDFSACNNKVIGARNIVGSGSMFSQEGTPPLDDVGHGSHTASTTAGNFVNNASALGNAAGVMSGIAPRAHIAVYRVCSEFGCAGSDILAGLDAAIADGVDVLSLSLGLQDYLTFDEDPVCAGTFSAIANGIFVSAAAGNYGPDPSTVLNDAPWLATVTASSIDRTIKATVVLGNGEVLDGESLYQPKDFAPAQLLLVDPSSISTDPQAKYCDRGTLDRIDVRGKLVLCRNADIDRTTMAEVVRDAGGAGLIIYNIEEEGYTTTADQAIMPASNVPYQHGLKLRAYMNSTGNPTAAIVFKGTITGTRSPVIGQFSSRGPSKASPGILKPDVAGPGVNILAAWPFAIGPPGAQTDNAYFAVVSGTSMATPHVSGVAALIKKAHPDWSPAAIKSAIMTTADAMDRSGKRISDHRLLPADIFALGAGHVNPTKAVDPGLVYDVTPADYVSYLCGMGYNASQIASIVDPAPLRCSDIRNITEVQLNYPSITVFLPPSKRAVVRRTVTNVGEARSQYSLVVDVPAGVSAMVQPEKLRFSKVGESKRYRIVFERTGGGSGAAEGQVRLISRTRTVRSPVSIIFK